MEEQYNIKEILIQYEDLVKERESLKESISQIEKRISKMEQEGYTVIDIRRKWWQAAFQDRRLPIFGV